MNLIWDLFLTFAKIGFFTFGGGYAMLSLIENSCVERKKWITHDEMMDVTVIAESTPGPIAINCATFVGYKQAGFPGAAAATFGVILPSFAVIFAISRFLDDLLGIAVVANAFKGIKIAAGILVLDAGITMVKKMQKGPLQKAIVCASFAAMFFINLFSWDFSSIALMLTAAAVGLAVYVGRRAGKREGGAGK